VSVQCVCVCVCVCVSVCLSVCVCVYANPVCKTELVLAQVVGE
jgi:hypothetical protein